MAKPNTTARLVLGSALLTLSLCPLARAAAQSPIQQGENVRINYICRLDNDALAATTYREAALDPEEKRSNLFLALQNDAPEEIIAGLSPSTGTAKKPFDFADAIAAKLSRAVVGLVPGKKHSVTVDARELPTKQNSTIQLARVRRRPKELRMTFEEYRQRTGKEPVVGQAFSIDPAMPGTIASVQAQEVLIRFEAPVGKHIDTPFGPALVKDDDRSYLLEIQVKKGDLVRSGPMAGRISEVNDGAFTVDYGHPLAGEDLHCDVTVERSSEPGKEDRKS